MFLEMLLLGCACGLWFLYSTVCVCVCVCVCARARVHVCVKEIESSEGKDLTSDTACGFAS